MQREGHGARAVVAASGERGVAAAVDVGQADELVAAQIDPAGRRPAPTSARRRGRSRSGRSCRARAAAAGSSALSAVAEAGRGHVAGCAAVPAGCRRWRSRPCLSSCPGRAVRERLRRVGRLDVDGALVGDVRGAGGDGEQVERRALAGAGRSSGRWSRRRRRRCSPRRAASAPVPRTIRLQTSALTVRTCKSKTSFVGLRG